MLSIESFVCYGISCAVLIINKNGTEVPRGCRRPRSVTSYLTVFDLLQEEKQMFEWGQCLVALKQEPAGLDVFTATGSLSLPAFWQGESAIEV
ncbi:unnamed protein product [Arctogadus glacialis]